MTFLGTLLASHGLEVAVTLTATSMTTVAALAVQTYRMLHVHDRALFGDDRIEGYDGLVAAHQETTERVDVIEDDMTDTVRRVDHHGDTLEESGLL